MSNCANDLREQSLIQLPQMQRETASVVADLIARMRESINGVTDGTGLCGFCRSESGDDNPPRQLNTRENRLLEQLNEVTALLESGGLDKDCCHTR